MIHGEEALRFLRKESPYEDSPDIDLILLDINMPIMDGRETMEHIAKDPILKKIPVVILTTSKHEDDIANLYQLRCSSYITKPIGFDAMTRVASELTDYWFQLVKLPTG